MPNQAVMNRGNFSLFCVTGARKAYVLAKTKATKHYEQLVEVINSSKRYEEELIWGGLDVMPTKSEGTQMQELYAVTPSKRTYTPVGYGAFVRITHEMDKDDQYAQVRKINELLGRSGNLAVELAVAKLINNANATTYNTCRDGLALASAAHVTYGDVGVDSNLGTVDISFTGIETAKIAIELVEDEYGYPLFSPEDLKQFRLITHPNNQFICQEILKTEKMPYSNENTINSIRENGSGFHIDWATNPFLSDTAAFTLIATQVPAFPIVFVWREKPLYDYDTDFLTKDLLFSEYQRFIPDIRDWRGLFFST